MFSNLKADFEKRLEFEGVSGTFGACARSWFTRSWLATIVYRFGRYAGDVKFKPLSLVLKVLYYPVFFVTQGITGISIQAHCRIGAGLVINGGGGIFILAESIGTNFVASSGITVGNVRGSKNLPIIGNNVFIEPGAKILGEVKIADDVVIRGNSLVLTDIPENTMAVGNPARIKRKPTEEGS